MAKQKILIMETNGAGLRSTAEGWTCEDGDLVKPGPIGNTPGARGPTAYAHATPLHAIGAGWRLSAPPLQSGPKQWEWWFVREEW